MIKHILLAAFFAAWGFHLPAQVLTVRDSATGAPLVGASVYDQGVKRAVYTDQQGKADIASLEGFSQIVISYLGYRTVVFSFEQLRAKGFEVGLTVNPFSIGEISVSALRWQQDPRETPHKIRTIRPREVWLQNPQTAADLLGASGEVFIQKSQQGGGSPMIRGFATNRVLITVDGVRMNTAIFRSGNLQNVISLDPYATERTEVIFGPGAILYGSDAIGGVMNFFTLSPAFSSDGQTDIGANAALRYASANQEKTAHADIQVGGQKWALLSSATYTDYGDLRMGKYGPDEYLRTRYVERINGKDSVLANPDPVIQKPTGYDQINLMQKIRFDLGNNWDIQVGAHYSATSNYSRYDRLIRPRGNTLRSAEWDYGPQKWAMTNLEIGHASREAGWYDQLKARIAYQFFEESRIERNLNSPTRLIRTEQVNAYSANLDLLKKWRPSSTLFYGAEFVFNKVGSTGEDENIVSGAVAPGAPRYPDGAGWHSYGAYLTYAYKPSYQWTFQAGLRYGQFGLDAEFDDAFYPFPFDEVSQRAGALTGSIGAVHTNAWGLQMSANLSTGFRAPNVDDMGKVFESTPGAVVVPNPDLGPEYAWNADLAFAKAFGDRVKADLTAFYTLLNNALVRRPFTLNGQDSILYDGERSRVEAIQNAAQAHVWGIQAGLEVQLENGFGFVSRFNFQKGEEEVDNGSTAPLRHAAPWYGATHLTYTKGRLRGDLYTVYSGGFDFEDLAPEEQAKDYLYAKDEEGRPWSPGWITLNVKAMAEIGPHLVLTAGLENIADVRYRPYSSGLTGPGRNLVVGVRWKGRK